jgi:hypothetical protein
LQLPCPAQGLPVTWPHPRWAIRQGGFSRVAPTIARSTSVLQGPHPLRYLTVPKNQLMLIAGVVWCLAGAMVMLVGLPLELRLAPAHLLLVPLAVGIFLVFYLFVFSRLVHKHTRRIRSTEEERLPFWHFFNASSWAVMVVMMAGGMLLRASHLVPDWGIAFFYSGLGTALFICGLRFLAIYARKDVLVAAADGTAAED